jgi:hypothetical protein
MPQITIRLLMLIVAGAAVVFGLFLVSPAAVLIALFAMVALGVARSPASWRLGPASSALLDQ